MRSAAPKTGSPPFLAPLAAGFVAVAVLVTASHCEDLGTPVPVPAPAAALADAAAPDASAERGEPDGGAEESPQIREPPEPDPEWVATMKVLQNPPKRVLPRLQTPRVPRKGWPVTCAWKECVTPEGEPGYRCEGETRCFNPCPVGMGPGHVVGDWTMCLRFCNTGADCPDKLCVYGMCVTPEPPDRWSRVRDERSCSTPDGREGYRVEGDPVCYPYCKKGLVVYGGDRCAKLCSRQSDCPGGECGLREEPPICGPICTSEGCPYPWE